MADCGDQNNFLMGVFTDPLASPFGTTYRSMHEVGFNRRDIQPTTGGGTITDKMSTGKTQFKIPSTLGHLAQNMYLKATFTVKPKDITALTQALADKTDWPSLAAGTTQGISAKLAYTDFEGITSSSGVGASRTLTQALENVKCWEDGLMGCVEKVEMRHNSISFQQLTNKIMTEMKKETYTKEDLRVNHKLSNGGDPLYHYLDPRTASHYSALAPEDAYPYDTVSTESDVLHGNDQYHAPDYAGPFDLSYFKKQSKPWSQMHKYINTRSLKDPALTATIGPLTLGYDGMHDNTESEKAGVSEPAGYKNGPFKTKTQQLQWKLKGTNHETIVDDYLGEFGHEIGLKDLPQEVLAQRTYDGSSSVTTVPNTTAGAVKAGAAVATALSKLRDIGGWQFEQYFEIPHPWHYNVSDAFPILNLVNDVDVDIHWKNAKDWIKNYAACGHLIDMELADIGMTVLYYDIPKAIWDSQFDQNRQNNYYFPDYQEYEMTKTLTVPVPSPFTDQGGQVAKYATSHTQFDFNINTIDRVARYFKVDVLSANGVNTSSNFSAPMSWDVFGSAHLEVSGEKLLTKIIPKHDIFCDQGRATHFKEQRNYCRRDSVYFPFGLDCDIHNPGGGCINIRPFYNNLKLKLAVDPYKVHQLYESGLAHVKDGQSTGVTDGTGTGVNANLCSKYEGADGASVAGLIKKGPNGTTYEMNVTLRVTALVQNLLTFETGQLYPQA